MSRNQQAEANRRGSWMNSLACGNTMNRTSASIACLECHCEASTAGSVTVVLRNLISETSKLSL